MKLLANILWHVPLMGFVTASISWLLGLLLSLTIVAAPIGIGLMEYGKFLFHPFGYAMISKNELSVKQNKLWKVYSKVISILYFPFGLILTVISIFQVAALCFSIIGIPVALVIAKSLSTFLNPVNKKCVHGTIVDELAKKKHKSKLNDIYIVSEFNFIYTALNQWFVKNLSGGNFGQAIDFQVFGK